MTKVAKKNTLAADYPELLSNLKTRIQEAQVKAALAVNQGLICLYWEIGKEIVKRQEGEKWGSKVIERLAKDLQNFFPGIQGFSKSNVFRMRGFYLSCEKVAQAVRQFKIDGPPSIFVKIPWSHNIALMEKLDSLEERIWYANQTVENGWSRNVLMMQIQWGLYHRQGSSLNNFHNTLPHPQSDLAHQTLKDPYSFDFLTLADRAHEQELEQGLVDHIQKFLKD